MKVRLALIITILVALTASDWLRAQAPSPGQVPKAIDLEFLAARPSLWPKKLYLHKQVLIPVADGKKLRIPPKAELPVIKISPKGILLEAKPVRFWVKQQDTNLVEALEQNLTELQAQQNQPPAPQADGEQPTVESSGQPAVPEAPPLQSRELTPFIDELEEDLLVLRTNRLSSFKEIGFRDNDYFVLIFGGGWNPETGKALPKLVDFYNRAKRIRPKFEFIFISADRSEREYSDLIKEHELPWPVIDYDQVNSKTFLNKYAAPTFPNILLVNRAGELVMRSHDQNGAYLGPEPVMEALTKLLGL